jgi:hypothetical protein
VPKAARAAGVVTAPAARALDAASQPMVDSPGEMDEHPPQIRNWTPGVHPRGKKENSVAFRKRSAAHASGFGSTPIDCSVIAEPMKVPTVKGFD